MPSRTSNLKPREVLAGSYDEKVDMWSVGVVLYVMLTGLMPWRGSDTEVVRQVAAGATRFHPRYRPGAT